jgi:hypothetical protein
MLTAKCGNGFNVPKGDLWRVRIHLGGAGAAPPRSAPAKPFPYQDGAPPFLLINSDQPDSELIFAILQKILLVQVQNDDFWPQHFPWFINRPYENKFAGEVAYQTRRTMRMMFNREQKAELRALWVYARIPCIAQFVQFLKRHPEKRKMMSLVWYLTLKVPTPGKFLSCFRILYCLFAAKFSGKKS